MLTTWLIAHRNLSSVDDATIWHQMDIAERIATEAERREDERCKHDSNYTGNRR